MNLPKYFKVNSSVAAQGRAPVETKRTRKNPYTTYDVEGVLPPGDLVSVLKCSRGVGGVVGGEGMQLVRVGRWMVCLHQRNIRII